MNSPNYIYFIQTELIILKTTVVSYDEFADIDFKPPSTYYIRDAQGYVFIHTRGRDKAQEWADTQYGKGMYTVRASKLTKTAPLFEGHPISARG